MGLLSRISTELPAQVSFGESKNTGLLAKTTKLFESPVSTSFSALCNTYSFLHCALFTNYNDVFIMTQCKGIDAITVASSISSRDYWDGTIGSSDFFVSLKKIDNKFSGFYQIFSSSFKEQIQGLHFLRITSDCIFVNIDFDSYKDLSVSSAEIRNVIICYLSSVKNEDKISTVPKLNYDFMHTTAYLMLLSVKIAVNSSIRNVNISNELIHDCIFTTIYKEILCILKQHFLEPNICIQNGNGEIKLVLFAQKELDDTILQYHIAHTLKPVLSSFSNSIILLKTGTASSEDSIRKFIFEG
ncbi:MAG: hypothetical protein M0P01_01210 [Treponema sp.]|nr:hypothetical protein [Treponema sp.]